MTVRAESRGRGAGVGGGGGAVWAREHACGGRGTHSDRGHTVSNAGGASLHADAGN